MGFKSLGMPRSAILLVALASAVLAAPCGLAATPSSLSPEDKILVDQATDYLQNLGEVKGRFVQTDPRGAVSQGELYLKRPGRARFAYDPPSGLVVVSDGRTVSVFDPRLRTFNHYPLKYTPLSLFLARQIRLDRGVVVSGVTHFSNGFGLTARDGRREAQGQITLTFADDPMRLSDWTMTDARGQTTHVQITGLEPATGADPSLFELHDPRGSAPSSPGSALEPPN
jgi:outer membrane lipoprotein-sorting protein